MKLINKLNVFSATSEKQKKKMNEGAKKKNKRKKDRHNADLTAAQVPSNGLNKSEQNVPTVGFYGFH